MPCFARGLRIALGDGDRSFVRPAHMTHAVERIEGVRGVARGVIDDQLDARAGAATSLHLKAEAAARRFFEAERCVT